jgi:hypothetical protein
VGNEAISSVIVRSLRGLEREVEIAGSSKRGLTIKAVNLFFKIRLEDLKNFLLESIASD